MPRNYAPKNVSNYKKPAQNAKYAKKPYAPKSRPYKNKAVNYLASNYKKPYKYPGVGRAIGSAIGGMSGIPYGSTIGGIVGQGAHALVKTITGHGDYTVQENALVYNRDAVPQFSSSNPRCTVLTHSEFVRDIKSSTTFQLDTFDINASNSNLFPWLSQVARNYEQIIWQGLVFQYKPTSGSAIASTNNALGTLVMATQYNSLAEDFVNKQQMENYEFSQSTVPSNGAMHPIECDPSITANQGLFYCDNPTNQNYNADPRLYNIGKFNIATVGQQANGVVLGELWATYKVCLMKPRQIGNNNQSDQWILDYATLTNAVPWGLYPFITASSTSALYNPSKVYNTFMSDQSFTALYNSPWESTVGNGKLFINPSFTGQIIVIFQVKTSGALNTNNEPVAAVTGNIVQISAPSLSIGFAGYDINGCLGGFHACYAFQVQGGFNTSGNGPTITLSGGSYPHVGDTVTQASLAVYAVANNLRNPANS